MARPGMMLLFRKYYAHVFCEVKLFIIWVITIAPFRREQSKPTNSEVQLQLYPRRLLSAVHIPSLLQGLLEHRSPDEEF